MPKANRRTRSMFRDVTIASSRADMLYVLTIGGARGGYGFARYPEGIFASPRDMVVLRAEGVRS